MISSSQNITNLLDMDTIIYYRPEPANIFALASLWVNAIGLTAPNFRLTTRLSDIFAHPDDCRAYVFDVFPKNPEEVTRLAQWLENRSDRFVYWLDNHAASWGEGGAHMINSYADREVIKIYPESTPLKALIDLDYLFPDFWSRAAQEMAAGDMEKMSPIARLYYRAFKTAQVNDRWERGKDMQFLPSFFQKASLRLFSRQENEQDTFHFRSTDESEQTLRLLAYELYDRMFRETTKAIARINSNAPFDHIPQETQRKIGYANLSEVTSLLDMLAVMEAGQERFPKLFVVQYEYKDHSYTAALSREFDARTLLEAKENVREINPEAAIKLMRKKIWELNP